jgi:hypothetical protein
LLVPLLQLHALHVARKQLRSADAHGALGGGGSAADLQLRYQLGPAVPTFGWRLVKLVPRLENKKFFMMVVQSK